ncbi:hypothetical protein N9934_01155 [Desulfosarcina sp.]|nr:hypothetical protein [Desulfosarcina sp.]
MKKATLLNIGTILVVIIATTFALISYATLNSEGLGKEHYIGQKQMELKKLYVEAEGVLFYLDRIGSLMLIDSLFDLGEQGGLTDAKCDSVGDYNYWIGISDNCTPTQKFTLATIFEDSILDYSLHVEHFWSLESSDWTGWITSSASTPDVFTKKLNNSNYVFSVTENQYGVILNAISLDMMTFSSKDVSNINYSIRPSFKAFEAYDIGIYNQLYDKAEKMEVYCRNKRDYQKCVEEYFMHLAFEMPGVSWEQNCDINDEAVFNSFIEQIGNCMITLDDECVCDLDMDIGDQGQDGDYEITLYTNGTIIMGELKTTLDKVPNFFGADRENTNTFAEAKINLDYGKVSGKEGTLKDIEITFDNQDSYDIVRIYKDYIENPIIQKDYTYTFVEDSSNLRECGVFPRYAKVCVKTDNEYEIFENGQIVLQKILIKFALYFKDLYAPKAYDASSISIINKENDERALIVSFPEHADEDVYKYKIYYSNTDFDKNTLPSTVEEIFESEYSGNVILNLADDKIYYVAILPIDIFGNVDLNFNTVSALSEDNLAPGPVEMPGSQDGIFSGLISGPTGEKVDYMIPWTGPVLNSDGDKEIVDLQGYFIYYTYDPLMQGVPPYNNVQECIDDPSCIFYPSDVPGASHIYTLQDMVQGTIFIAISAIDEVPNYLNIMSDDGLLIAGSLFEEETRTENQYLELEMAEGGWVCDPDDTGGETYKGITMNYNQEWPLHSSFWDQVHDIIGTDDCNLGGSASQASMLLNSDERIQSLVGEFYIWYMEKHGVDRISDQPMKKLLFNFIFNTPVGTTSAAYYAYYLEPAPTRTIVISQELASKLNSYTSLSGKEQFAHAFSKSLYSYYSKGQEKFRRGWFNRLKNGVNHYLSEIGSDKRISIVDEEGVGTVIMG